MHSRRVWSYFGLGAITAVAIAAPAAQHSDWVPIPTSVHYYHLAKSLHNNDVTTAVHLSSSEAGSTITVGVNSTTTVGTKVITNSAEVTTTTPSRVKVHANTYNAMTIETLYDDWVNPTPRPTVPGQVPTVPGKVIRNNVDVTTTETMYYNGVSQTVTVQGASLTAVSTTVTSPTTSSSSPSSGGPLTASSTVGTALSSSLSPIYQILDGQLQAPGPFATSSQGAFSTATESSSATTSFIPPVSSQSVIGSTSPSHRYPPHSSTTTMTPTSDTSTTPTSGASLSSPTVFPDAAPSHLPSWIIPGLNPLRHRLRPAVQHPNGQPGPHAPASPHMQPAPYPPPEERALKPTPRRPDVVPARLAKVATGDGGERSGASWVSLAVAVGMAAVLI